MTGTVSRGLAKEQASLRRVATLVARGAPASELFRAVTEEVGRVLSVENVHLLRYECDDTAIVLASFGRNYGVLPAGAQMTLGGRNVTTLVLQTGRSARIDDYDDASGPLAVGAREHGVRSSVAAPIVVEASLWGVMVVGSSEEQPLPADTEARLAGFTELIATAIANAESRAELARLAEEQGALRHVATLVAQGTPQEDVLAAVTEEVARLFPADWTVMCRYLPDDAFTIVASVGSLGRPWPVGGRWPLGGNNAATLVFESGRPVRIENYAGVTGDHIDKAREDGIRSTVATPIIVEGRVWGLIGVATAREASFPADTEARLCAFTELVATAIANGESRAELALLVEQQAALRRVATLVAQGPSPEKVFLAVTDEIGRLLAADMSHMVRYESDDTFTVIARSGARAHFPVGSRWPLGAKNTLTAIILETGRPARVNSYAGFTGPLADEVRAGGVRSSVAAPIIVEGRVWGLVGISSVRDDPPPADTEARLASFTELVATAVANTESRAELTASRRRLVAAADDSRRRIERDLHDGAQQRLVHTVILQKLALRALQNGDANLGELMTEALRHTEEAQFELRELAHGILPAALTRGGLRAGVESLVSRVSLPVSVEVTVERLPAGVEATAYFVISEALTNVVKHAHATGAEVIARVEDGKLRIEVRDDGIGGARGQAGLEGLKDRVSALGGHFELDSPTGGGTRVCALLPAPQPR